MKPVPAFALFLCVSCTTTQKLPTQFPAAANAFLAQELPPMEVAVAAKDRDYFVAANDRMQAFLISWDLKSPTPVALERYPACTDAVTDFLIAGLCRISPPNSICEPSTFLPRLKANIAKCDELARIP